MHDSITRAYTALLRRLDPRLYLDATPHSQRPNDRVYWIRLRCASGARPKLTTLEAACAHVRRAEHLPDDVPIGPGTWICDFLNAWNWRSKAWIARHDLSRSTDAVARALSAP